MADSTGQPSHGYYPGSAQYWITEVVTNQNGFRFDRQNKNICLRRYGIVVSCSSLERSSGTIATIINPFIRHFNTDNHIIALILIALKAFNENLITTIIVKLDITAVPSFYFVHHQSTIITSNIKTQPVHHFGPQILTNCGLRCS